MKEPITSYIGLDIHKGIHCNSDCGFRVVLRRDLSVRSIRCLLSLMQGDASSVHQGDYADRVRGRTLRLRLGTIVAKAGLGVRCHRSVQDYSTAGGEAP